jgi:hypothetical protein
MNVRIVILPKLSTRYFRAGLRPFNRYDGSRNRSFLDEVMAGGEAASHRTVGLPSPRSGWPVVRWRQSPGTRQPGNPTLTSGLI